MKHCVTVQPDPLRWFPFGLFAFCCSFWFFAATETQNEHCDFQKETSTKTITSKKRHFFVLVFEIEFILSQKQERATKSSKKQRTASGNTHQKPKRATKSNKKQQKATKSNKKQQKATKSNEEQQKAKTDIGAGKTITGNQRHKNSR